MGSAEQVVRRRVVVGAEQRVWGLGFGVWGLGNGNDNGKNKTGGLEPTPTCRRMVALGASPTIGERVDEFGTGTVRSNM